MMADSRIAGLCLYLAQQLGGRPHHHLARARRAAEALERWYGPEAVPAFLLGSPRYRATVVVRRVDWKTSRRRTPRERAAEVLGFVSGKTGPYARWGRFRPHLLLIKGAYKGQGGAS